MLEILCLTLEMVWLGNSAATVAMCLSHRPKAGPRHGWSRGCPMGTSRCRGVVPAWQGSSYNSPHPPSSSDDKQVCPGGLPRTAFSLLQHFLPGLDTKLVGKKHHHLVGYMQILGGDFFLGRTQKVWGSCCLLSSKTDVVAATPTRVPHLARGWAMVPQRLSLLPEVVKWLLWDAALPEARQWHPRASVKWWPWSAALP